MPKVRYQFDAPLLFSYAEEQLRKRVLFSLDDGRAYPAWDWSFLCEALLNAYRRTGDDRHLALVRNAIDHAYSLRDIDRNIIDPRFGVPRETWGIVKDDAWATVVTTPGRIVTPALDFLMIAGIRDDILEKSIAAVELCLQDFVSFGDEGLFKRPAMDDWEPLNHSVSFGRALLRLFSLTEDERYLTVVKQLATFFKRSLVLEEDDYYGWAYRPNREDRHKGYPTNFWKADIDLAFVVDCHKQKIVFDGLDIGRFSQTLKKGVLRSDFINCRVAPKRAVPLREKAAKIGPRAYGLCGWMVLSEFDDEIEPLLDEALAGHTDILRGGWFGVPHAAWGYSFKR